MAENTQNNLLPYLLAAGAGAGGASVFGGNPLLGAGLGALGELGGMDLGSLIALSGLTGMLKQAKPAGPPPIVDIMKEIDIYALKNPGKKIPVDFEKLRDPNLFGKPGQQPSILPAALLAALGGMGLGKGSSGGETTAAALRKLPGLWESVKGLFSPSTNSGYTDTTVNPDQIPLLAGYSQDNPSPYAVEGLDDYGSLNPYTRFNDFNPDPRLNVGLNPYKSNDVILNPYV